MSNQGKAGKCKDVVIKSVASVYFSGTGLSWTLMPSGPPGYTGPLDGQEYSSLTSVNNSATEYALYRPDGIVLYIWHDSVSQEWNLIFADDINIWRGAIAGTSGTLPNGTMVFEGGSATIVFT